MKQRPPDMRPGEYKCRPRARRQTGCGFRFNPAPCSEMKPAGRVAVGSTFLPVSDSGLQVARSARRVWCRPKKSADSATVAADATAAPRWRKRDLERALKAGIGWPLTSSEPIRFWITDCLPAAAPGAANDVAASRTTALARELKRLDQSDGQFPTEEDAGGVGRHQITRPTMRPFWRVCARAD